MNVALVYVINNDLDQVIFVFQWKVQADADLKV